MRSLVSLFVFAVGSSFVCAQIPQPAPAPQQQPTEDQQPPPPHIALRVVGSQVRSPSGERLGRIEEVLVNRTSGTIDYAVLAPSFPTNQSRLVPVPWSILTYAWDQSRAGGPAGANQIFIANIEPARLAKAPSLDRSRATVLDPALASANSHFGVATGGTGTGSSTVTGTGSGQPVITQPAAVVGGIPTFATPGVIATGVTTPGVTTTTPGATDGTASLGAQRQSLAVAPGGFAVLNTNGVVQTPTNANSNVGGTPLPGTTNNNGVVFQPGSQPPYTPFPGRTSPGTGTATTNATGPSGPSAGGAPPIERSQGVPRTPVQQQPPPNSAPAAQPPARPSAAPSAAPAR